MEAPRMGVPRTASAQAIEQRTRAATTIDRSCMDSNLVEYVISMTTTPVETLLATSWTAESSKGCHPVYNHDIRKGYFSAMAPTRDSKILKPSVPPSSGSLARSG